MKLTHVPAAMDKLAEIRRPLLNNGSLEHVSVTNGHAVVDELLRVVVSGLPRVIRGGTHNCFESSIQESP
jgi:hypothetical protein